MKIITLTTDADRRNAERTAISEAIRRAIHARQTRTYQRNLKLKCRDAVHNL